MTSESVPVLSATERVLAELLVAVEEACPVCHGEGWVVEGDPSDETGQTPMQVPCWDAEHAVILNSPLSADLATAADAERQAAAARIAALEGALREAVAQLPGTFNPDYPQDYDISVGAAETIRSLIVPPGDVL